MTANFSKLTAFEVFDLARPWGKIRDFLLEFPSGRARYFSVEAEVGVGMKEVWAPMECLAGVDGASMRVTLNAEMDKGMSGRLSRLEEPQGDADELRLHNLYHTRPDWLEALRSRGGRLRRSSRLVRASRLIGSHAEGGGGKGRILDLLFDEGSLGLCGLRLDFGGGAFEVAAAGLRAPLRA